MKKELNTNIYSHQVYYLVAYTNIIVVTVYTIFGSNFWHKQRFTSE